jgi:hypothetical protein
MAPLNIRVWRLQRKTMDGRQSNYEILLPHKTNFPAGMEAATPNNDPVDLEPADLRRIQQWLLSTRTWMLFHSKGEINKGTITMKDLGHVADYIRKRCGAGVTVITAVTAAWFWQEHAYGTDWIVHELIQNHACAWHAAAGHLFMSTVLCDTFYSCVKHCQLQCAAAWDCLAGINCNSTVPYTVPPSHLPCSQDLFLPRE